MIPRSDQDGERFDRAGFEIRQSSPIELAEVVIATEPELLGEDRSARQDWDGFDPPFTLKTESDAKFLPIQKNNLKPGSVYQGIEAAGDRWARMACDIARESVEQKGGPFGAVVLQVDDQSGRILRYWTGCNEVALSNDPTAHAEVVAIRKACASLGVFDLGAIRKAASKLEQPGETSHCVIYSSTEPCPMCYGAIRWARLKGLFFAATRFDAAVEGVGFSDQALYEEFAKPYSERGMKIRQCEIGNSLDAFNLWKRSEKIEY